MPTIWKSLMTNKRTYSSSNGFPADEKILRSNTIVFQPTEVATKYKIEICNHCSGAGFQTYSVVESYHDYYEEKYVRLCKYCKGNGRTVLVTKFVPGGSTEYTMSVPVSTIDVLGLLKDGKLGKIES